MPAIAMDPNNMTRDKLKAELQKFNISLPPSGSRKDAYIELYKSKVLNKGPVGLAYVIQSELAHLQREGCTVNRLDASNSLPVVLNADRLEFSSDDDSLSSTPKRNKKRLSITKRSPKKLSKKPVAKEEMDVESLSDDQLAAKLRELGVDVGPILDSTRKVYRRKLQKMLDQSENTATEEIVMSSNDTEIQEQEFSDNDETEVKEVYTSVAESYTAPSYTSPVLETYKRRTLRDSPQVTKSSSRTSPRRPKTYPADEVDYSYTRQRYVDKENHLSRDATAHTLGSRGASNIVTQAKEKTKEKKKGTSIWIQLIIIAVVAVIIFLIIQNMEPANQSPIGKLSGSEV